MSMSIVSALMALVMMLTGVSGVLGGTKTEEPVSVEIGLDLSGDISPLAFGQSGETVSLIQKLVNAVSLRVSADASSSQLEILLDGESAVSMAVKFSEEAWEVVSGLFPTSLLTVKKAKLESFLADTASSLGSSGESADSVSGIDMAALAIAAGGVLGEVKEAFQSRYGEAETGSFPINDVEYTEKSVCSLTTKEAAEIILSAIKKILSDENAAPVVSLFGGEFSPESLDEALESLQKSDEAEMPALSVVKYKNSAGSILHDISMEQDSQFLRLQLAGTVPAEGASAFSLTLSASMDETGELDSTVLILAEGSRLDLDAAVTGAGFSADAKANLDVERLDGAGSLNLTIPVPGGAEPIALGITGKVSHDAPVFDASGAQERIDVEDLMEDESLIQTFSTKVMLGAMQIVSKVAAKYPEIMQLMNPSSPGTEEESTEETPAEEIPAEEAPADEAPAEEAPAEEAPAA